jgi:hypothetical protein
LIWLFRRRLIVSAANVKPRSGGRSQKAHLMRDKV